MASWSDLGRTKRTEPKPDELAELCALVLSSGRGADLLNKLLAAEFDKVAPAGASESALRDLNARRQFVRDLERWTARGLEIIADKSDRK